MLDSVPQSHTSDVARLQLTDHVRTTIHAYYVLTDERERKTPHLRECTYGFLDGLLDSATNARLKVVGFDLGISLLGARARAGPLHRSYGPEETSRQRIDWPRSECGSGVDNHGCMVHCTASLFRRLGSRCHIGACETKAGACACTLTSHCPLADVEATRSPALVARAEAASVRHSSSVAGSACSVGTCAARAHNAESMSASNSFTFC